MIEPAQRALPILLARNAEEAPGRVFLADASGTLSRAEVWAQSQRLASGFLGLGLEPGDRVAIMLDNCREFVLAWFGLAAAGLVEVPLNPAARGERLVHTMTHSGATALITDARFLPPFEEMASELPELHTVVVVGGPGSGPFKLVAFRELAASPIRELPAVTPADTAAIMYTSGSTGLPKGAIVPHGQHVMNGWQAVRQAEITEHDRIFVTLPLHHNMAQGYGVMPAVLAGAQIYISIGFKRATFWDEVISSGSTVFTIIGSILALLATVPDPETNPLRVAFGVPIPPSLHEELERRWDLRIIDGYGSTEGTIPAWGSLRGDRAIGSSGQIVPEFDLSILNDDDVPVVPGEIGDICIRPREPYSMFQGYFRDPERTLSAVRNFWFHSGDRGRIDEQGNLWFEGRSDDVIRRFGEFISAKEVEDAIAQHDAVELVACYGISSDIAGQEVMAGVVVKNGHELDAEALRAFCSDRLPEFAVPRFVEFLDELPMTPTGKVEKHKLRQRGVTNATNDARSAHKRKD
jgi:crotonobetaine/carnitine-CoA ligase